MENITFKDILDLAEKLPSGLNDKKSLEKLNKEYIELKTALENNDYIGALTEGADAVYYCIKYLDYIARQLNIDFNTLLKISIVKYSLRAIPGNPKDDENERKAVKEVINA